MPVSPAPVGQINVEDCSESQGKLPRTLTQNYWNYSVIKKGIAHLTDVLWAAVHTCVGLWYSYHSVQWQRSPLALGFAGYWGDCCYGILEMNNILLCTFLHVAFSPFYLGRLTTHPNILLHPTEATVTGGGEVAHHAKELQFLPLLH